MKFTFLSFALLFAGIAGAQHEPNDNDKRGPEEKAAALTKKMTKELSLTPEQVAKIEPQNVAFFQQQVAHQEQIRALREQQKAQMDAHRKNIHAVLTPEQQKKADKLMEERKDKRKERMKKRRKR